MFVARIHNEEIEKITKVHFLQLDPIRPWMWWIKKTIICDTSSENFQLFQGKRTRTNFTIENLIVKIFLMCYKIWRFFEPIKNKNILLIIHSHMIIYRIRPLQLEKKFIVYCDRTQTTRKINNRLNINHRKYVSRKTTAKHLVQQSKRLCPSFNFFFVGAQSLDILLWFLCITS